MSKKKKKSSQKTPWYKDKVIWGNIVFLTVPLATATISAFHVFTFIGIGNSVSLAVATAIVYEIFVIAGMYAIVTKSRASSTLIWMSFIVIAVIQIIGNTYHAFNYISDMSVESSKYLDNFINFSRMIFGVDGSDVIRSRYVAALLIGTPVPVISFMITKAAASIFSDNVDETISIWSSVSTMVSTWFQSITGKLEVKSVDKYIKSIQKEVDDRSKEINDNKSIIESFKNRLDVLEKENVKTSKSIGELDSTLKDLKSILDDLTKNLNSSIGKNSSMVKILENANKSLQTKVIDLNNLLLNNTDNIRDIKNDISKINEITEKSEVINNEDDNMSSLLS